MYTVSELLCDLEGHESEPKREIKIKLKDGTVKNIEGINYRSIYADGDEIIYITERDDIWEDNKKELEIFLKIARNTTVGLNACTILNYEGYFTYPHNEFAENILMEIESEAIYWLEKLNIEYMDIVADSIRARVWDKIKLLAQWYNDRVCCNSGKIIV